MTAAEVDSRFLTLVDFTGSPYFTDKEKTDIANTAQLSVIQHLIEGPDKQNITQPEAKAYGYDSLTDDDISVLKNKLSMSTTVLGTINISTIEAAIVLASDVTEATLYRIAAAKISDTTGGGGDLKTCKFVRDNDFYTFQDNIFKKATASKPQFRKFERLYQFDPRLSRDAELITLRYPKEMLIDTDTPSNNIDPELRDEVMNFVIARMVTLSGLPLRDQMLYQSASREEGKEMQ